MKLVLTPELLLHAYKQGVFPMAYSADSPYVHWVCPEMRAQLSITDMHIPRSLKKLVRRGVRDKNYEIKINTDFDSVIRACAQPNETRPETWINDHIIESYNVLHRQGYAHSVEYWEKEELKGGLYGLGIGGAFFGESMFSRTNNASKIALVHLVARLWTAGFTVLDAQFVNDHLLQFGIYEIPHEDYIHRLGHALKQNICFETLELNEAKMVQSYLEMRLKT